MFLIVQVVQRYQVDRDYMALQALSVQSAMLERLSQYPLDARSHRHEGKFLSKVCN